MPESWLKGVSRRFGKRGWGMSVVRLTALRQPPLSPDETDVLTIGSNAGVVVLVRNENNIADSALLVNDHPFPLIAPRLTLVAATTLLTVTVA